MLVWFFRWHCESTDCGLFCANDVTGENRFLYRIVKTESLARWVCKSFQSIPFVSTKTLYFLQLSSSLTTTSRWKHEDADSHRGQSRSLFQLPQRTPTCHRFRNLTIRLNHALWHAPTSGVEQTIRHCDFRRHFRDTFPRTRFPSDLPEIAFKIFTSQKWTEELTKKIRGFTKMMITDHFNFQRIFHFCFCDLYFCFIMTHFSWIILEKKALLILRYKDIAIVYVFLITFF